MPILLPQKCKEMLATPFQIRHLCTCIVQFMALILKAVYILLKVLGTTL